MPIFCWETLSRATHVDVKFGTHLNIVVEHIHPLKLYSLMAVASFTGTMHPAVKLKMVWGSSQQFWDVHLTSHIFIQPWICKMCWTIKSMEALPRDLEDLMICYKDPFKLDLSWQQKWEEHNTGQLFIMYAQYESIYRYITISIDMIQIAVFSNIFFWCCRHLIFRLFWQKSLYAFYKYYSLQL